jgi:hypothetical protein
MEPNSMEVERFKLHQTQLKLQILQVVLSTILVYFIVKNSMTKQNLPDSIIEDEED